MCYRKICVKEAAMKSVNLNAPPRDMQLITSAQFPFSTHLDFMAYQKSARALMSYTAMIFQSLSVKNLQISPGMAPSCEVKMMNHFECCYLSANATIMLPFKFFYVAKI